MVTMKKRKNISIRRCGEEQPKNESAWATVEDEQRCKIILNNSLSYIFAGVFYLSNAIQKQDGTEEKYKDVHWKWCGGGNSLNKLLSFLCMFSILFSFSVYLGIQFNFFWTLVAVFILHLFLRDNSIKLEINI